MRKIVVFLFMIFLSAGVTDISNAQLRNTAFRPGPMITLQVSLNIPTGDTTFNNRFSPFLGVGIEPSYQITPMIAVYGNLSYNFLSYKNEFKNRFPGATVEGRGTAIMELYGGSRLTFSRTNSRIKPLVDFGIGTYQVKPGELTVSQNNRTEQTIIDPVFRFAYNVGAGVTVGIEKKIDLIIKGKYHNIPRSTGVSITTTTVTTTSTSSTTNVTTRVTDLESINYFALSIGLKVSF